MSIEVEPFKPERIGTATLLEIVFGNVFTYFTCAYSPPIKGETIFTNTVREHGEATGEDELLSKAKLLCGLQGYELIVPDDYRIEGK